MKVIGNTKIWKAIIAAMKPLDVEAYFIFSKDSIKFKSMNASHNSLLIFDWNSNFTLIEGPEEAKMIEFVVEELDSVIKRFNNDADVEIEITDKFILKSENKEFELRRCRVLTDNKYPNSLKVDLVAGYDTEIKLITEYIKDTMVITETFYIEIKDGVMIFSAAEDKGKVKIQVKDGFSPDVQLKTEYSAQTILENLTALGGYTDKVKAEFSTQGPMKLTYNVENMGLVEYWIAHIAER